MKEVENHCSGPLNTPPVDSAELFGQNKCPINKSGRVNDQARLSFVAFIFAFEIILTAVGKDGRWGPAQGRHAV